MKLISTIYVILEQSTFSNLKFDCSDYTAIYVLQTKGFHFKCVLTYTKKREKWVRNIRNESFG